MKQNKRQLKAMTVLNLDLFQSEVLTLPAPATIYAEIDRQRENRILSDESLQSKTKPTELPSLEELYSLFDRYNWMYFEGRLPRVKIEYSKRMSMAGAYYPGRKLIRIGQKYHNIFPEEVSDTLKHEMIHIIYMKHDTDFKAEAKRIGTSLKARYHPDLEREPKYLYHCDGCGTKYPRQKRLVMASCGNCSSGGVYDERFKLKLLHSRVAASTKS